MLEREHYIELMMGFNGRMRGGGGEEIKITGAEDGRNVLALSN